jgi:hypothetical protein
MILLRSRALNILAVILHRHVRSLMMSDTSINVHFNRLETIVCRRERDYEHTRSLLFFLDDPLFYLSLSSDKTLIFYKCLRTLVSIH